MKKHSVDNVLLLPEQFRSKKSGIICVLGYLFRCALAFSCSFSFSHFILNSIGADLPSGLILITAVISCAVLAVMERNSKLFFLGFVSIFAVTAYLVGISGGIKNTLSGIVTAFYNCCASRLEELGYSDMSRLAAGIAGSGRELLRSEYEMLCIGSVLLTFLICAMFVFLTLRKTYILPIILTCASLLTFVFFFGMGEDCFCFAVVLSSFCGLIALSRYDSVFVRKKAIIRTLGITEDTNAAQKEISNSMLISSELGGFPGVFAAIVAFTIIIIPTQFVAPMNDIPAISEPIKHIETRFFDFTGGISYDTVLNSAKPLANEPRQTIAKIRQYSDTLSVEVGTDINTPVYLRSWIGTTYKNDSWTIVSEADLDSYRSVFGPGFSPELLTAELLTAVDPSLTHTDPHTEQFGYTVAQIHIKNQRGNGGILLTPSYTDPRKGLFKFGSDEPHPTSFVNYYEGIFASNSRSAPDDYSVYAMIPFPAEESHISSIYRLVGYCEEQFALISPLRALISAGADDQTVIGKYEQLYAESASPTSFGGTQTDSKLSRPVKQQSLAYRYAYEMTAAERSKINALIDNIPLYEEYVRANYLSVCEGEERFVMLMDEITAGINTSDSNSFIDTHRTVEAVIAYLASNLRYTISPKSPSSDRDYLNAADTMLFDTREGYCVQYATCAAMLLRAYGIPARYAEGYVATDFEECGKNEKYLYQSNVTDSRAHSWIEVYYDGFGWVSYEVTTTLTPTPDQAFPTTDFSSDKVSDKSTETPSDTHSDTQPIAGTDKDNTSDTTVLGTGKENDTSDNTSRNTHRILTVILTATVLTLVSATAVTVSAVKKKERRLRTLIKNACEGNLSDTDAVRCAAQLNDDIITLLKHLDFEPADGELALDFAHRVDCSLYEKISYRLEDIMPAMQANEFSTSATKTGLRSIAEYYGALYTFAANKSGWLKGIYIKYFSTRY